MNLGKTCEFICEQIRIDKTIRDDKSIDTAKIRDYILEHLDLRQHLTSANTTIISA